MQKGLDEGAEARSDFRKTTTKATKTNSHSREMMRGGLAYKY